MNVLCAATPSLPRSYMGFFQSKQQKPQSNLIKGTFIWVQVSVGTEYQVILCINTEAWGWGGLRVLV